MTLSELTYQLRMISKVILIFLATGIFLIAFIFLGINLLQKPQTKSGPKIDPKFGIIEKPVFEQAIKGMDLSFTLDTIDSQLPVSTATAYVYFVPTKEVKISYLKKVNQIASELGFNIDLVKSQPIDERTVRFEDEKQILTINTDDYFFNLSFKLTPDFQNILTATPEADFVALENTFLEKAKTFLANQEFYYPWIASGRTNLVYLRYDLGFKRFTPVKPEETPQAIQIDFFRQDLELPVVSPKYYNSQNNFIFSPLNTEAKIINGNFSSVEKLDLEPGTYPLLTINEAWQKLLNGEVKTVSVDETANEIKVQQIFVAYYDPETYQKYFQPIFVFLGNNNYVGYLAAVRSEYLE